MFKRKKESIARPIAPEDIRAGDYIALLHEIVEYVPGCWCDVDPHQKVEARRFSRWPTTDESPLRVTEVCLPYVFVRQPSGEYGTLDTRRCRIAALEGSYGRRVFAVLAKQARNKKTEKSTPSSDKEDE